MPLEIPDVADDLVPLLTDDWRIDELNYGAELHVGLI